MLKLLRSSSLRQLLARQLPSLAVSMLIAETFYKLGSFTLECIAFLVTWLVVDFLFESVASIVTKRIGGDATG